MFAHIFPTPESVAADPKGDPPKFEVVTTSPVFFAIEATTDNTLFNASNSHLRNRTGSPLNFYNSLNGIPKSAIPATLTRTPPSNRAFISLPKVVWGIFKQYDRIYYRVLATAVVADGKPVAEVFFSIEDKEYQSAPYIHVLRPTIKLLYSRGSWSSPRGNTPWLVVSGNKLTKGKFTGPPKRQQNAPAVVLRGVNFSGLQYREPTWNTPEGSPSKRWWDSAGITQARIQEIASWGANILRMPINQDYVLNGAQRKSGLEYLKDIDQIIDWAAAAGMYTLLDLHVLDTHRYPDKLRTQPMPENMSLLFWRILAERYRSDPAVLYDLCNEPHRPKGDQKRIYETQQMGYYPPTGKGWIDLWHEWARQLEGVIHYAHVNAVIFVSGIGGPCWAASLRSMPVSRHPLHMAKPRPIPNAVYSSHIYFHSRDDGDGVDESMGKMMGTANIFHWDHWFGFDSLRTKHPIFLGELGAQVEHFDNNFANLDIKKQKEMITKMLKWGNDLFSYLNSLSKIEGKKWQGLAGWTAWSWGNKPHLVERKEYTTPTPRISFEADTISGRTVHKTTNFGNLVKTELGKYKPKNP